MHMGSGENPLEYIVMTMEGMIITNVDVGGNSKEDRLTEKEGSQEEGVRHAYLHY